MRILIVDDESMIRGPLEETLRIAGYSVDGASDGREALTLIKKQDYDVVISDLAMPSMGGLELLEKIKKEDPSSIVLLMTGFSSVKTAVTAIKLGAYDYIEKPFAPEELMNIISGIEDRKRSWGNNIKVGKRKKSRFEGIIGHTPAMNSLFNEIGPVAKTDASVLITGENGTGKELVANAIHSRSMRKGMPYIRVNCAALTGSIIESELFGHEKGAFTGAISRQKGLFEMTNGGTLFLDEIGELPPEMQGKLLRVLESSEFKRVGGRETLKSDFRLICATNIDIPAAVKTKRFREDLLYRINTVTIPLPPLRERISDLPFMAEHFLRGSAKKTGKKISHISSEALSLLLSHHWPGNVRELKHTIERSVIYCEGEILEPRDLPPEMNNSVTNKTKPPEKIQTLDALEAAHILEVMKRNEGNIKKTSFDLNISRSTLYKKLEKYNILKSKSAT